MFGRLAEAIETLEVPPDAASLRAALRLLDRFRAKVTAAVAAFDASGAWADDGATSLTAWLRSDGGQTAREAGRTVGTARALRQLPATRAAWAGGSLSGGQVEAIVANLRPATVGLFADHEDDVLPRLTGLTVAGTAAAMRHWARLADALVDGPDGREPERSLHVSSTLDGRTELAGSFDAEGGAVVATAVRLAATPDVDGEPRRSPARRRADALVDVCRFFLDHQSSSAGRRHRPHLNVVVDLSDLERRRGGRLLGGPPLDPATIERLLCDAGVHRVVTAGRSAVLDYGTTTRTVPAPLWAALVLRDEHCRFPGCDRPPPWCEGHHVVPVQGPTRLDNLVLFCTRHHHRCHRPGWQVKLLPDGDIEVTTPGGQVLRSSPPGRGPPAAALAPTATAQPSMTTRRVSVISRTA